MLVHAHNRSIDHLHGGIMSSRQRIHDLVPEAALCGNETVVIVGAGNSSAQASLQLARYARKVIIVMRGERLNDSVSQYLVDRIKHTPNIEVLPNTEVKALHGERMLEAVTLRNRQTGDERTIETGFLFLCLGGVPNTDWAGR